MIDISKLTEEDFGKKVIYKNEIGFIKGWNSKWIFVVYCDFSKHNCEHWQNFTAAATDPNDLSFVG